MIRNLKPVSIFFTAALGCVSSVVRYATGSGRCGLKVPSGSVAPCCASPLPLLWWFDRFLAS